MGLGGSPADVAPIHSFARGDVGVHRQGQDELRQISVVDPKDMDPTQTASAGGMV